MEQCRHIFTEILEQENASWLHPAAFDPTLTFQCAPYPESSLQNKPIHMSTSTYLRKFVFYE